MEVFLLLRGSYLLQNQCTVSTLLACYHCLWCQCESFSQQRPLLLRWLQTKPFWNIFWRKADAFRGLQKESGASLPAAICQKLIPKQCLGGSTRKVIMSKKIKLLLFVTVQAQTAVPCFCSQLQTLWSVWLASLARAGTPGIGRLLSPAAWLTCQVSLPPPVGSVGQDCWVVGLKEWAYENFNAEDIHIPPLCGKKCCWFCVLLMKSMSSSSLML